MLYLVKTPWLIKKIFYPKYLWHIPTKEKKIYLTFDDGPHPEATTFVLDQLQKYNAKATFFCIGKNVAAYPEIYKTILFKGHSAGNHTQDHVNGWKSEDELYFNNIFLASKVIDSKLFRPPYGKITGFQAKQVMEKMNYKIVMWSVLSGDFDKNLTMEDCYRNVIKAVTPGAIIVFHDSEKSFPTLKYVLPKVLDYFLQKGYAFENLNEANGNVDRN
jgi:peptidoglycan/xylan/chitin deacetylase (PgdA/CDA1 family)